MKKKFIILCVSSIIFFILVNIFYGFFYEDNIENIMDKILFRTKYYSREILEKTIKYNNIGNDNIIRKNNISIRLANINYKESSGILKANFELSSNEANSFDKISYMMKINDKQNVFYNERVGEKLYVDNLDYLLFNNNLYNKLSNKRLDTDKLDDETHLITLSKLNETTTNIEITLNLEKNYKIQENLYIEFLNLIYQPKSNNSHKVFDGFGSFSFVINF